MPDMPPDIIRQFLAQSDALFIRLDRDLAELEHSPRDPAAADRLSGALAAIRTGAGFLDLLDFEHAAARASDALRTLRHAAESDDANALAALAIAVHAVRQQRDSLAQSLAAPATTASPQANPVPVPTVDEQASACAAIVETSTARASIAAYLLPETEPELTSNSASRLDEAMSEVGNLVVQANRLAAIPFQSSTPDSDAPVLQRVERLSDELTRATSGIRHSVQHARALPIMLLFARCTDALSLDRFDITDTDLQADSTLIDRLTAPLITLIGACAASPRIRLSAQHDAGADILELAITGAIAPDSLDAALVAARAPLESMRATIAIQSDERGHTNIRVRVPANPVFLHCTLVRIGRTHVAFPIDLVCEVVRPEPDQLLEGTSTPVVMLAGGAAALLDGASLFGDGSGIAESLPYAVVVQHAGRRVALSCSRPVAAMEIVVRPMDPLPATRAPISGVGALPDGSPALIVDIPALIRLAGERPAARRAAA